MDQSHWMDIGSDWSYHASTLISCVHARASIQLDFRELDFQGDPADEIIAATSVIHGIPRVTRDAVIRTSMLVSLAT